MEKIKNLFENLDKLDLKIMKNGIKFCFVLAVIAIIILSFYLSIHNAFLYELGIAVFKLSTYIAAEFVVCGIIVDKIKEQVW